MLNYQYMETKHASKLFEALSSEYRLDIFRQLVISAPQGLVAGEIAKILHIPSTNLSFHLKNLVQSDLVHVEREGRYMRYKANISLMLEVVRFLTEKCCDDDPAECQRLRAAAQITLGLLPERCNTTK